MHKTYPKNYLNQQYPSNTDKEFAQVQYKYTNLSAKPTLGTPLPQKIPKLSNLRHYILYNLQLENIQMYNNDILQKLLPFWIYLKQLKLTITCNLKIYLQQTCKPYKQNLP
eukprot:EC095524.1.p5 GENE.EC095524.1~~EC095524.1.p5  ORF type:complete len:111 (-),score=10.95 EC095524.1:48-380(-)